MSAIKKILLYSFLLILSVSCVTQKPSKPQVSEDDELEKLIEQRKKDAMDPNVVKYIALTFDDGPSATMTPRVLDRLEKYDVPATFFLVGMNIKESTRAVLERAVSLGCEFGNHSWDYNAMNTMSAEKIKENIDKTSKLIEEYTGQAPKFFRPPNLAKSDVMWETIELPFIEGYVANDWAGMGTDAEKRAELVLNNAKNGAIILMHDVQPEPHPTPEALDIIIPELKARGYVFLTVSDLFKQLGVDPNQRKAWQLVK